MVDQKPELRVFKIKLPMRIRISSKKQQPLNLNVYRNLHFRSLSSQKNKFYKIAKKLLRGIPPLGIITLHYDIYPKSKRRLDIMNIGSIVDKYFSDALTETGIIEDDDYIHIPCVSFAFGGLVKKEHLLVTITEIEPRKGTPPMRVLLDDDDILKALTVYVGTLNIPNASGVEIDITDGKLTAEIMFVPTDSNESKDDTSKPSRRGRGGRPKGSKNLPKVQDEETADVDAPVQASADNSGGGTDTISEDETPTTTDAEGVALPTGEVAGPAPKTTKKENLFGDKDDPSSEDDNDNETEVALDTTPEPPVKKKGSIFDA